MARNTTITCDRCKRPIVPHVPQDGPVSLFSNSRTMVSITHVVSRYVYSGDLCRDCSQSLDIAIDQIKITLKDNYNLTENRFTERNEND